MLIPDRVPCPGVGIVMDDMTPSVTGCPHCGLPYVTLEEGPKGDPVIGPHTSTSPQDKAVWLLAPTYRQVSSSVPQLNHGEPDFFDREACVALVARLMEAPGLLADLARLANPVRLVTPKSPNHPTMRRTNR